MPVPKVSVVIPVYNSEKYIEKCINSLINQTLKEIELIFVNDGSTDNSLSILLSYKEKDSRILVITQENEGISRARNAGLDVATGRYLGFCDNDDYVESDMFEKLFNDAVFNGVDIVISKTILGRDKKEIIKDSIFPAGVVYDRKFIQKKLIPNLLEKEDLFAVWNKLYERKLITEKKIKFPENRDVEEDAMFNIMAFNCAHSVYFTEYCGYHFRELQVSESRKYIDKDYFVHAISKYNFDYKSKFNLELDQEEIERLTAIRFVKRAIYLTFACAIEKEKSFNERMTYISNMVFNEILLTATKTYKHVLLLESGKFEKIIIGIILTKNRNKLKLLVKFISIIYRPWLSEILRFFNKH